MDIYDVEFDAFNITLVMLFVVLMHTFTFFCCEILYTHVPSIRAHNGSHKMMGVTHAMHNLITMSSCQNTSRCQGRHKILSKIKSRSPLLHKIKTLTKTLR